MSIIDIIVPVYQGVEATRRCLASILEAKVATSYELIVVNDASPEPELVRDIRELARLRRITLLEQPSRQGFASAVNRAIALHRDRDVVILHADAEVANDWLDRLAHHARIPRVGAVAPFTNAYGVATYPRARQPNALPPGHAVASLDRLFARANDAQAAALPALAGPCIYVRRECLAAAGAFDGSPLGSDYAVITDFCLRAGSAGFQHLLAGDTFVGHIGHVSYGAEAERLGERAEFALERLYPAYGEQKAAMTDAEPSRPFARQVDLLRLIESSKPVLVFISHRWGGGIRRHMNDLAALAADRCTVLYLEPAVGDTVRLYWPREGEDFAAYFTLPAELPQLAATLRAIGVARLHFHHVNGLPHAILDLPPAVGAPYDCTLHDYYSICPQYHLVDEVGRYCGEPDATGCAACLTRRPGQWGLDITTWRGAFGRLLRGADRLIAPSNDVAQRTRRYFPELAIQVWPHAEPQPSATPSIARVIVLGNLSPEKGLHVVAACAEDAQNRRLPLTFRVLGSTTEPIPQAPEVPLTIHGQYDDSELARLLAAEKPDVLWFPAQVPETYSYTLSVALASGRPIVSSALGALPERLSAYAHAATVRWNAPAAEWNAALLAAAGMTAGAPEIEFRTIPLVAARASS